MCQDIITESSWHWLSKMPKSSAYLLQVLHYSHDLNLQVSITNHHSLNSLKFRRDEERGGVLSGTEIVYCQ